MEGFPGFPEGGLKVIPLPELFFSELLPIIDDLFELKVTLYCFWLLHHKRGDVRHVTSAELQKDAILMRSLPDADVLRESLERAVARGTLLQVTAQRPNRADETWYFLNSERGREAVAHIERGEWVPEDDAGPVRLHARRPNIFNLYEQNIGTIQPLLAEELKDAEQTYPPEWIEEAFRIAVANNARGWAYVRTILQRWAREGRRGRRGGDARARRRRYTESEYANSIEH